MPAGVQVQNQVSVCNYRQTADSKQLKERREHKERVPLSLLQLRVKCSLFLGELFPGNVITCHQKI